MNTIDFLRNAANYTAESCYRTISKGFDEEEYPIYPSHFIPFNEWSKKKDQKFFIIDKSTGDYYFNDSLSTKRLKCLALVVVTPVVHAVSLVLNAANRIAKLVTLAHLWYPSIGKRFSLEGRVFEMIGDFLRVAFTPIIYLGLELSAIYGVGQPNDGGKLYATFERCAFGRDFLAPCFQPEPTAHLGGGSIHVTNSW